MIGRFYHFIFLTLLVTTLAACTSMTKETIEAQRNVREVAEKARQSCLALDRKVKLLCTEIVNKKVRYHRNYMKDYNKIAFTLDGQKKLVERSLSTYERKCSVGNRHACWSYRRLMFQQSQRRASYNNNHAQLERTVGLLQESLYGLSVSLHDQQLTTRYLCETRGFSDVQCQTVVSSIAQLDSEAGRNLIKDIARAEQLFRDEKYDTLIQCGSNDLTTASIGQSVSQTLDGQATLAQEGLQEVVRACASVDRDSGGGAGEGGFSGASGIGRFPGSCGLGVSIGQPDQALHTLISTMTQLADACEGTSSTAPYAGSGGRWEYSEGTAIRPPGALTGKHYDIDIDNRGEVTYGGDPTGTVENPEGWQQTTWSRNDFADGHTQTVTAVSDEYGDIVWLEAEARYADGTSSTYSYTLNKEEGYERHEYSSTRTGISQTSSYYSNGTETHEFENSNTSEAYSSSMNADGSTEYNDTDGNHIETDANGNVTSWTKNGTTIVSSSSCADPDWCGSCNSSAGAYLKASMECAGSLGSSYACQSFLGAQSCCQNENTPGADPRLAMPTPEGDLACIGGQGPSRQSQCDTFCSVASSDIDCQQSCMQDRATIAGGPSTLLSRICQYAISEQCFGGSISIAPNIGTSGPAIGGGQPLPTSSDRLIFGPLLGR